MTILQFLSSTRLHLPKSSDKIKQTSINILEKEEQWCHRNAGSDGKKLLEHQVGLPTLQLFFRANQTKWRDDVPFSAEQIQSPTMRVVLYLLLTSVLLIEPSELIFLPFQQYFSQEIQLHQGLPSCSSWVPWAHFGLLFICSFGCLLRKCRWPPNSFTGAVGVLQK